MPYRPKQHKPQSVAARRATAAQRGYGYRWRKYSQRYLRSHPLCVHCSRKGSIVVARQVDHIEPVSGPDDPLFWVSSNHQPLCHSCHSEKTARDKAGGKTRAR